MYQTPPTFYPHLLGGFFIPLKKKDQGTGSDCYIFEAPHGVLKPWNMEPPRTTPLESTVISGLITMGYPATPPNATGNPYEIVGLIRGLLMDNDVHHTLTRHLFAGQAPLASHDIGSLPLDIGLAKSKWQWNTQLWIKIMYMKESWLT